MDRVRVGRRNERGVVAVVVSLVACFVLIPLAALAVDIGVQRVAVRDMQSVADVTALDVARLLDGRTYAQLAHLAQTTGERSAARNPRTGRASTIRAELGTVNVEAWDPEDPQRYFTPTTDATVVPNAVRITSSTRIDFSLAPGQSGGATRTAIAVSDRTACFKVGSYGLRLNSANSSLLNFLVGDALNVSAITYTGLAGADISLLGLAAELGVATPDELVGLDNLSLGRLYLAIAHVLQRESGSTANVSLLNQLANLNLGALPPIKLGDLLHLQDAPASALSASVNVLDLVAASAFLANGQNALAIPNVGLNIPGLVGVNASLKIIQAPVMTCGPVGTQQHTAQVSLDLTAQVPGLNLLWLVGLSAGVTVNVEIASGTVTLKDIQCGRGAPEGIGVSVGSALAQLGVGLDAHLKALGLPIADISGSVGTVAPPENKYLQFRSPPSSYSQPMNSGSGLVLPQLRVDNLDVTLLGLLPLGATVSGLVEGVVNLIVAPVLNPLLSVLNQVVLGPISSLLGLNIAGVDVFAVPSPICGSPRLGG